MFPIVKGPRLSGADDILISNRRVQGREVGGTEETRSGGLRPGVRARAGTDGAEARRAACPGIPPGSGQPGRDSLFLWVGAAPALASLAVAMCSPRDSIPVAASLLGDPSDTASSCLAQRLASKTKKQIFVSYNLQNTDSNFTLLIENRIKEEMTAFPDKF
ncbi:PREDICTED: proteasome assembly chaperone 4 [Ficedula albicollis]|uniref:proteasome assembly chaperone 4 n=1 Tax=Ficedula albicollis TaxID=59894 RepID=UPI000359E315|nr:PREDICTED: proteasome assembly chaperone 4 [Ficedula albicollis]